MKRPKIKIHPIWLAMMFSTVGIIGTRLVYGSITGHASFLQTIVGIILLVGAVITVGIPLAYSMYWHRELRVRKS